MRLHPLKKMACIATLLAGTCLAIDAPAITLTEAMEHAYGFNPSLKAQRSALEGVNEQLPQAYSGFLPSVSASYQKSDDEQTLGGGGTAIESDPTSKTLTVSQPVFNGLDSFYQIKQARNNISRANHQLHSSEQQTLTDAIVVYIDVVRTREIVGLSKHNESVLAEQLQATKDRFELGETTNTDVAQSETRLARATSDRVQAEGQYIRAKAEYKHILGINSTEDMKMPDILPEIPDDLDTIIQQALANNPQIKSAHFNSKSLQNAVRRSKSSLLPVVDVVGTISRREGLSSTSISSDIDTDSVALNVTIPLYQSGAEYSRIRQAKRNHESAQHQHNEAVNNITSVATNAWQQVITTRADTEANRSSVKSAGLALDGVRQEQEVGSRTTLDVLDAEQELFTARVNLITSIRNSVLAVHNVKAAMGELTAGSLDLRVNKYSPSKHLNSVKYKFIGF